jgi:DNA-binding GntR family transcriptional regulator
LTQETYLRLRDDIVAGRIRPNERLVAADLASHLGISRTPVREALQLLEAEDFVVSLRRGYVVREHSREEVVEIYLVRAALEGMAARLVAERSDDDAIDAIEATNSHRDEAAVEHARPQLVASNAAFHAAILSGCGNARLARVNLLHSQQFFNYRIAEMYTTAEALQSVRGHAAILAALRAHDPNAAEQAAREHVLDALEVTLSKLR